MLTTFNFRAQPGKEPLYRQLADYFRQEIHQQHLVSQDFLPSIRKLTRDLKLSRTTAENAYQILIDQGYVENLPNRGYRVAVYQPREASEGQEAGEELRRPEVRWNFSNNYIDTSTFDTVLWRRCLNQVLRNPASIAGYGDPQGEPELRRVLARYSYASRGVVCRPEQILVGAGLQTLLLILLPLLPLDQKVAGLEAPGFPQAEQIFHLMGWKTRLFDPADPKGDWPGLLMISPANPYKGRALTEKERNNLIVATQRPSADVITGLMKANIPSRIAFAVASSLESRIILDTTGAEKLVGRGDMLYAPLGEGKPRRVQGCFISAEEIDRVVGFVKANGAAQYDESVIDKIEQAVAEKEKGGKGAPSGAAPEPVADEGDELLPAAIDVVMETGQASVSMLQRRLKLGYSRAARIVDEMEQRGIVGPFEGSKPRQLLITREKWEEIKLRGGLGAMSSAAMAAQDAAAENPPVEEEIP